MLCNKKGLKIIMIFMIISSLFLGGCSNQDENVKKIETEEQIDYETKSYNVKLEDMDKIQSLLNLFLMSAVKEGSYIDILDGRYNYNDNNELIYVFLYNSYSSNNELETSSNIGFITASKITCINLVNENLDFAFNENELIEFIETDKKTSNESSIIVKTTLHNKKENKDYNYMITFKIINEIEHDIKIDLLN